MSLKMVLILSISVFAISCEDAANSSKEADQQQLASLFEEIEQIASSETCTNASEWKFTAYGSKACGGSQGYIAYSIKIDESNFLKLVENYTNEESKFNQKWGIISDCSLVVVPKSVICKESKPHFEY